MGGYREERGLRIEKKKHAEANRPLKTWKIEWNLGYSRVGAKFPPAPRTWPHVDLVRLIFGLQSTQHEEIEDLQTVPFGFATEQKMR